MAGVSAWYLHQRRHRDLAQRTLRVAMVVGLITSALLLPIGHWHAVQVAKTQPEKLAAFEGLFTTQRQAPLTVFGLPDPDRGVVLGAVRVPGMLSLLISGDQATEVKGLNELPRDEWPPVRTSFVSFHLMFLLGMYFILVTGIGVFLLWRQKLFTARPFLKLVILSTPLPVVACELGWIAAEVGRQPWIVYRVPGMRTAEAVSPSVSAGEISASILMFAIIYFILGLSWLLLMRRQIMQGPEDVPSANEGQEVPA